MFNNKKLLIVFGVLLAIAALVFILDSTKKEEGTFKQNLVSIDSAKVTKIVLYTRAQNHKEVLLFKEPGQGKYSGWKVQIAPNKFKTVPFGKIQNLLNSIENIKPISLAARTEGKWKDFQVDTSGTRVEVYESNSKTLDIVIGKFAFRQPRSMTTYVRLADDKNVYSTEGFLELTFNKKADDFRNDKIIDDDYNNWRLLTFTYPGDSSFQLIKKNNKWYTMGESVDSAKTAQYLSSISHLSSSGYYDKTEFNPNTAPIKLRIESDKGLIAEISAEKIGQQFIIASTQNHDELFDGNKNNLGASVFKTMKDFLPGKSVSKRVGI